MRNFLKGAVIVILLLLLAFYGFSKYREYVSYQNIIHKDADVIIKVNVDQLFKKIAVNAINNSSYYSKRNKKDSIDVVKGEKGLEIKYPGNIFAYNLKNKPNTFFVTLKVKDTVNIEHFLSSKFKIETFVYKKGYSIGVSKNKKVQVVYTNKKLVASYSLLGKSNLETLKEILFEKKVMSSNDKRIDDLKKNEGDVVIVNKDNNIEINFNEGRVVLTGSLNLKKYLDIPSKVKVEHLSSNSAIRIWLAGNLKHRNIKNHEINDITIPLDSLLENYKGFLDINIAGHTTQLDTIIAYEYNDDFEKIEIKTLHEKEVPGITILARGNTSKIIQLLEKEEIVINHKINRTILPMYDFNVGEIDSTTLLIRNINSNIKYERIESNEFFHLDVNFNTLLEQSNFSMISDHIKNMNELNIVATKEKNFAKVKGELLLKNETINAVMQIFQN